MNAIVDLRFEIGSILHKDYGSYLDIRDLLKCVSGIPELLQKAFHNLGAQLFGAGKQVVQYCHITIIHLRSHTRHFQVVSDAVYLRQDEISITNTLNRFSGLGKVDIL